MHRSGFRLPVIRDTPASLSASVSRHILVFSRGRDNQRAEIKAWQLVLASDLDPASLPEPPLEK
jgi:hypothetical protein